MTDFPDVPNAPGVPPVARRPGFASAAIDLLTSDLGGAIAVAPNAQWGLFLGGAEALVADNVLAFEYDQRWRISDYPLEQGAFESYNKVNTPFSAVLRYSVGGSISRKQAFLARVAAVAGDLELYDAVTPEVTYPSVNVMGYSYSRRAVDGVGLLKVDVLLFQIRETATQQFVEPSSPGSDAPSLGNAKSPTAVPAVSSGTAQPVDATPQQTTAVNAGASRIDTDYNPANLFNF